MIKPVVQLKAHRIYDVLGTGIRLCSESKKACSRDSRDRRIEWNQNFCEENDIFVEQKQGNNYKAAINMLITELLLWH